MEITYFGHSCFKIKTKDLTLVIDPRSKLLADVVLFTHSPADRDFKEARLVIDGPGEYELSGVNIFGISTGGGNVMYYIEADGTSVLHCGDLEQTLDETTLDKFGEVTVLMIPVGGIKVISSIEPSFVIPIAEPPTLEKFLDEMGIENGNAQRASVLKVSPSDNDAETSVVVLEKS